MTKGKKRILAASWLCLCMLGVIFVGKDVHAEEFTDRPYTGIDEEGQIIELEAEVGIVEESVALFSEDDQKIVNFNTKGNAITEYVEADTGIPGYTNGAYGADAVYLGTENGKVKFMLSGVVGYVNAEEVQVINRSSAKSISHYAVSSGWLVHRVSYNLNSEGYGGSIRVGKAPEYLTSGLTYYSYDGNYFYTDYNVMIQDYRNSVRDHAVNAGNPYYNYFQYLPLRSTTSYSEDSLNSAIESVLSDYGYKDSKMQGIGGTLVNCQNTYGVNALIMVGIAANESGWGTSNICRDKNNLFGLNAVDSTPYESANYFKDVDSCIREFAQIWMSKGYLNPEDSRYYGGFLGNKASGLNVKYGSDPYWGEKTASIAWNLDERVGGLDQYGYTLAVKDVIATEHHDLWMRSGCSSDTTVLYHSGWQSNTSFILLDSEPQNNFYMVQSDALINEGRTAIDSSTGNYNFGTMYAYVGASYLTIVNNGNFSTGVDRFKDVSKDSWFYEYVDYVYGHGIMTGMNASVFAPGENLSRAQFAVIIYRMAGSPSVNYESVYKDVPENTFYTSAAIWAKKAGVITGYDDGSFGGTDEITREQMATIIYRYADYKGFDVSEKADITSFPDAGLVSGFASEAVEWTVGTGLIQGDQGYINPQGFASRAHCAAIITRFMKEYGR